MANENRASRARILCSATESPRVTNLRQRCNGHVERVLAAESYHRATNPPLRRERHTTPASDTDTSTPLGENRHEGFHDPLALQPIVAEV